VEQSHHNYSNVAISPARYNASSQDGESAKLILVEAVHGI
jgi:hypothetical protein